MEPKLKYSHIFWIVAAILALNIVPVIVFWDQAALTEFSFFPLAILLIAILNGILAVFLKHKDNYFKFARNKWHAWEEDRDETFTVEYEKEFRLSMLIYCVAVPFFIPTIFFVSGVPQFFLTIAVGAVPQVIFYIRYLIRLVHEAKEAKIAQEKQQKELREQEAREEQGYWK